MTTFDKKNLKALKKQLIENKKAEKERQQEKDIVHIQEKQDEMFFLNAMSGVTPLSSEKSSSKVLHTKDKPKAKVIHHYDADEEYTVNDPLSDQLEVTDVNGEEVLSFCREGIQKNVFKKLRSGQYRISDELDLHGSSIKQAKEILVFYLHEVAQFEGCCIRIIHGKGLSSGKQKPVMKTYLNHWLSEHDRVLAFHSAKVKDGGTGAVYVLLKR